MEKKSRTTIKKKHDFRTNTNCTFMKNMLVVKLCLDATFRIKKIEKLIIELSQYYLAAQYFGNINNGKSSNQKTILTKLLSIVIFFHTNIFANRTFYCN